MWINHCSQNDIEIFKNYTVYKYHIEYKQHVEGSSYCSSVILFSELSANLMIAK